MIPPSTLSKVVIVGRPNVGKSSLFNRLVGKQLAIVGEEPGITRDWREARADLAGLEFLAIDTAGLEEIFDNSLPARMRRQTEQAIAQADVVLLVVDAKAGLTPLDQHFADFLRHQTVPVIPVVNKCDTDLQKAPEFFALGCGDPVPISAAHRLGMGDLFEALLPYITETDEVAQKEDIRVAVVGQPNVGKSTLINTLIDKPRLLVGPESGLTRDSIAVDWSYKDHNFRLVDTAGLRPISKQTGKTDQLATEDSLRAIRLAQIVVLVINDSLEKQDLVMARLVAEEGRALVIAMNKWDLCRNRKDLLGDLKHRLQRSLPQLHGIEILPISALKKQGLEKLLNHLVQTYERWNVRISTGKLNRWLAEQIEKHPPPLVKGRPHKVRYITQIKTRPPTFNLFLSKSHDLHTTYQRYLVNKMRDSFDLPGIPIRLTPKSSKNPFVDKHHS